MHQLNDLYQGIFPQRYNLYIFGRQYDIWHKIYLIESANNGIQLTIIQVTSYLLTHYLRPEKFSKIIPFQCSHVEVDLRHASNTTTLRRYISISYIKLYPKYKTGTIINQAIKICRFRILIDLQNNTKKVINKIIFVNLSRSTIV